MRRTSLLLTSTPTALAARFGRRANARRLDFWDADSFPAVLEGVSSVFLIRPPAISRVKPTLNAFIDAAAESGVEHIVFSSVAGADTNRVVPHHRVEQHLLGSEVQWTMLRPGFFAQNIGGPYRRDIVEDNRIYLPAGDGLVAFIDARDIGAVAALALTDPVHLGGEYHLTGPEAVTMNEVAGLLTDVLGRAIRYEPASILGYRRHVRRQGLPRMPALVQTLLHVGLRRGDAEPVTEDVTSLLGRPPRSLREYIEDNRDLWTALRS